MNASVIARILGALFIVAGIAGFLPWVAPAAPFDARVVTWDAQYRMLFGLFPVNIGHDAVHLLLGIWGLAAGARFGAAVFYCRVVTWFYLVLVVFGVIPLMNTLLGVAPIYGWDVLLHFGSVLLGAYGGYGRGAQQEQAEARV